MILFNEHITKHGLLINHVFCSRLYKQAQPLQFVGWYGTLPGGTYTPIVYVNQLRQSLPRLLIEKCQGGLSTKGEIKDNLNYCVLSFLGHRDQSTIQ